MKKALIIISSTAAILTACGQVPSTISERCILKEVNHELVNQAVHQHFVTVKTGVYDCPDEAERENLRKLAAAGLVTYNVERYAWWEKSKKTVKKAYTVTKNGFWGSYRDTEYKWAKTDVYDFCDHYVVTVELTSKGERLSVTSLPEPIDADDRDLKAPNIDESKYAWNRKDISESWPRIPNPFIEEKSQDDSMVNHQKSVGLKDEKKAEQSGTIIERIDSLQYAAFKALALNEDMRIIKAGSIKAIKARNIQVSNSAGFPKASAEVIIHYENATDAGRILSGVENDQRALINVTLSYYIDKGWKLDDVEPASDIAKILSSIL